MKRRIKHTIGILFAAVLLCTNVQWPAPVVSAIDSGSIRVEDLTTEVAEETENQWVNSAQELRLLAENWQPVGRRTPEAMDEETAEWVEYAGEELELLVSERDIMALVYMEDTYPVRAIPSYEGEVIVTVLSGQQVNILDVYVDENFEIWECVELDYKGETLYGYIPRDYLACSDARFLEWEDMYGMGSRTRTYSLEDDGTVTYADIEQFPESYQAALTELKEKHPNWVFVKMNTTLDWDDVVYNQLQNGKSLVYKTLPEWAKEGLYDTGNWYYASEAALEIYLDPRNGLTENAIFQFEQLTYNEEYHTMDAVSAFLNNTFMNDSQNAPGTGMTYATIFWYIGKEEGREVSPFHLVARVLQEQGSGNSPLISGTYPGYEGYYNYFNVGASGTTDEEVIKNGLQYAKDHDWEGAYYSILGGADFISANYIKRGQDSLYLQKYNVNPNGYYKPHTHQYMQNISAPTTEAASIRKLYEAAGALDSPFVFKIPVYENMPAEACSEPEVSLNVVVDYPEGYSDTIMWLDGVPYQGVTRNGKLVVTAPHENIKSAVIYKYNDSGVPTGMYVWTLSHSGLSYTATPEPELEDLLTYHGFSIRITGKSGIRFKTGISTELREKLIAGDVSGYTLKEYGTLVMKNANRESYPMVKGGEKVLSGMTYGLDSEGNLQDVIYETKEGRYRYTSVLVGMPASEYKTEYAFRGYVILEKNDIRTIIYGPAVAKSIYSLAEQLLEKGSYEPGSSAYEFLEKLIADADAAEQAADDSGDGTSDSSTDSGKDGSESENDTSTEDTGDTTAAQPVNGDESTTE